MLSGKAITINSPFLRQDLESTNLQIRRAAVKVYARNPQDDSAAVLLNCLDDPDEEIRLQAAYGLEFHESKECLEKLRYTLSDNFWAVRLQAAMTLRKFGRPGMEVLQRQNPQVIKMPMMWLNMSSNLIGDALLFSRDSLQSKKDEEHNARILYFLSILV